jgi:hypothetical protein
MLLTSLLPVGIVAFTLAMLLLLIYYVLVTPKGECSDEGQSLWNHHPVVDDDMAYLADSLYPRQEYVHFPTLPLPIDRQALPQTA